MAIVSSNLTCGIIVWLLLDFHSRDHSSLGFSFVITNGGRMMVSIHTLTGGAQETRGGFPDKWRSSSPAESRHWREDQLPATFIKAPTHCSCLSLLSYFRFLKCKMKSSAASYIYQGSRPLLLPVEVPSAREFIRARIWGQIQSYLRAPQNVLSTRPKPIIRTKRRKGLVQVATRSWYKGCIRMARNLPPANQKLRKGRQRTGSSGEAFLVSRWDG